MPGPRVSVLIPTFNRAFCVGQAVDSALAQTYRDREVIVIDDGSVDGTRQVLSAYGERIRVIEQDNRGVSAARNRGMAEARGEWAAFLDSDDEWLPEKLERQMQCADRFPGSASIACNIRSQDLDGRWKDLFRSRGCEDLAGKVSFIPKPVERVMRRCFLTSAMVVRREVLLDAGGFDESLAIYEDYQALLKVALRGPMAVVGDILVHLCRKGDPADALRVVHARRPPEEQHVRLIQVYRKVLDDPRLRPEDRRAFLRAISDLYYVIGRLRFEEGSGEGGARFMSLSILTGRRVRDVVRALAVMTLGASGVSRWRGQRPRDD
jgi:glycosyltransferase involved in cell wall biosynthesis